MKEIQAAKNLELQIIATGASITRIWSHQHIEKDGFTIDEKVAMLLSSDKKWALLNPWVGTIGFAGALRRLKPDMMVVLGDRFEIFSAAMLQQLQIPIAHIHGGEITEGAFDEVFRHSITKMSHLHFTNGRVPSRVIQLGEHPDRVFNLELLHDSIKRLKLLSRAEFEESIGFNLARKIF